MLGVNVAISTPNVCESNVVVRLQIKENDDTGLHKTGDQDTVKRNSPYQKYGFCNDKTLAGKFTHEIPESHHSAGVRFRPYQAECIHIHPKDGRPTRLSSVLHLDPSIPDKTALVSTYFKGPDGYDNSDLKLQTALKDSESHRLALASKLEETRSVVEKQNSKLRKIESAAIDNSFLMENLKFKEMEFRKAIDHFEVSVKEKHLLQLRNLQLKEDLQERVNAIDSQLRNIKRQQLSRSRLCNTFSDSTPFGLSVLMEENTKLQQDKAALSKRVQEMAEELRQLRSLLQMVTDENAKLSAKWTASERDKLQTGKQVEEYQNTVSDLKSRLSSVTTAHEQLLQEKFQADQKLRQMALHQEEEKAKIIQAMENSFSKAETEKAQEEYRRLHTEYSKLKQEHEALSTSHQKLVNRYGDEENEQKEKQEITKMRGERDDLQQQVTALHCQLSQVEDRKRQADDKLTKLTSELEEVKTELKLSRDGGNGNVQGDVSDDHSLKGRLEMLQKKTNDFHERDLQQETMSMCSKENCPHEESQDTFNCKSLDLDTFSDSPGSTEPSKTQMKGHYGGCFFNLPEKSDADENDHLQNLISKYASEREAAELLAAAKPLSRADSPKRFPKSRFNQRRT